MGRPCKAWTATTGLVLQRQAEIDEVGLALGVDEDVARLDVPVDQAMLVGVVERLASVATSSAAAVYDGLDRLIRVARSVPSTCLKTI